MVENKENVSKRALAPLTPFLFNSTTGRLGAQYNPNSRHLLGMAVDINMVGCEPVGSPNTFNNVRRLQNAFNNQPNIRENYGPALNTKTLGNGVRVQKPNMAKGHSSHIHVSGQR